MLDPHLSDLMHGEKAAKDKDNSPFEIALDKAIKEEVEARMEQEPPGNELLSPELRREKIEQEIRNDPSATESRNLSALAVRILLNEGSQTLDKVDYKNLYDNILALGEKLDALDMKALDANAIQEAFILSPEDGQSILKIGISKYTQGLIDESLAIFHFLTLVNPKEPDYWFRYGLTAEKCQNYPLALSALNTTSRLAPKFIGGHIFAAYCHLKMHSKEEALAELASAKQIAETTPVEDNWKEHISHVEQLMAG